MKNLLLSTLIFSSITYAEPILNWQIIEEKSRIIESQMKQDRYITYALNTCGVVNELYRWLPLIKNILNMSNVLPKGEEKQTMKEAFKASFNYLFYTKEGWVDIVSSLSSMTGVVIMKKLNNKFSHPDTLRWYMYNRAPLSQILSLMHKEVIKLNNAVLSEEQIKALLDRLDILYEQLIEKESWFYGYMVYKSRAFDLKNKKTADKLLADMYRKHSLSLGAIKNALSLSNRGFKSLESRIKSFREDIQADINHFALLEGESSDDFHIVLKKAKKISLF